MHSVVANSEIKVYFFKLKILTSQMVLYVLHRKNLFILSIYGVQKAQEII